MQPSVFLKRYKKGKICISKNVKIFGAKNGGEEALPIWPLLVEVLKMAPRHSA